MRRISTIVAAAMIAAFPLSAQVNTSTADVGSQNDNRPNHAPGEMPRGGGPGPERNERPAPSRPAPNRPSPTSPGSVTRENMSPTCRLDYQALDLELNDRQMRALGMPGYASQPNYAEIQRISAQRRNEIWHFAARAALALESDPRGDRRTREIRFWNEIARRAEQGRPPRRR